MPSGVYAAIFDLDGVLTSTSSRHEQSWAEAARRFDLPVSEAALRATRSVPRSSALSALLEHAGMEMDPATRQQVMAFKNERYHALIEGLTREDAFPGAFSAVAQCRSLGLRVGVASASQNAHLVLERIGLGELIDYVADSSKVAPKPNAEIYRMACGALGASPDRTACIEDGAPMIANLRVDGFHTIGIGSEPLNADEQFASIGDWRVGGTLERLKLRSASRDASP